MEKACNLIVTPQIGIDLSSPKEVKMELHLVYDRDTNGLLFTEFGPERGHIELAICCSLIVLLGKVQT